ncbi:MAG: DUF5652 family protein [Candidatus Vogelbacteria bacterium]
MDIIEIQKLTDLMNAHPYLMALGAIWVMVWKGLALWRAAEYRARGWFIVILVLNTLGLLEIIYLFFITKPKVPEISSEPASI